MRSTIRLGRFKRDVRRLEKRGKDLSKLRAAISLLIDAAPSPTAFRDHPVKGEWHGWRDLHIEPDWLLIYRVEENELQLGRTGTHADLFQE